MAPPRNHHCCSCERFAGTWPATCPYCGDRVFRSGRTFLVRRCGPWLAALPAAAAAADWLGRGSLPALPAPVGPAGVGTVTVIGLAAVLATLPPRPDLHPGPGSRLPARRLAVLAAHVALAIVAAFAFHGAAGRPDVPHGLALVLAVPALLLLPPAYGLNRAAIAAGALTGLALHV